MPRLALLTLVVLAAGCPADDGGDDYPIGGGGGGGGGGTSRPDRDAGVTPDGGTTTDGPALISGRVCVVTDLRRLVNAAPLDCEDDGASGLTVGLGGVSATTGPDGAFTIAAQEGANLAWRVTGLNLRPSFVPLSISALLPAITSQDYNDLLLANGTLSVDAGEGSIVARIVRGGNPVMGATARIVEVDGAPQTYYDGSDETVWGTTSTGGFGVAWLPDNGAGPRTLEITPQGASPIQVPVSIVDGAITFLTIALP